MASISPKNFYGKRISPLRPPGNKKRKIYDKYVLKDLLNGPSLIWKTFFKQEKALEEQRLHKGGLMPFVFESENSGRLFLIAHPEVFWHYNEQREIQDRCTYEIIRENTVSKLYFDLEYSKEANPDSDGDKMVELLIQIILFYLKKFFKIESSRDEILDLDSTNDKKFSRHLIFNLPHAFINNKSVGHFVQKMCSDIKNGIDEFNVQSLFVKDTKNKEILFIDEGVYTKNRHFRCYKNTKKGKNSPLLLSQRNTFKCKNDLEYFLSSLVTYVRSDVNILQFEGIEKVNYSKNVSFVNCENSESPYPSVDKFINERVKPGKIYRSVYFSSSNTIVYDIVNNRYCGNIKRAHKSNNVKYIVNLDGMFFYQKCHDWDCRDYKSEEVDLPEELKKEIRPETSTGWDELGLFELQDDEITPEMIKQIDSDVDKRTIKRFPSFGVSDEDLLNLDF